MARAPKPLFLGRSSYRRRRLADAARALPVFGAILLVLPLLWPTPEARVGAFDSDLGYLLALWLGMIVATAALARGLAEGVAEEDGRADMAGGPDGGPGRSMAAQGVEGPTPPTPPAASDAEEG